MELESIQRKIDSQVGIVDAFEDLLQVGEASQALSSLKLSLAKIVWESASEKLERMHRQKKALSAQLEYIQARCRRPALEPSPPQFRSSDSRPFTSDQEQLTVSLDIPPCPFCTESWEPSWELKLASCKCAYHSWCALTHFSSSLTCFSKLCNKEMHPDWWMKSGIPKPVADEEGAILGPWDMHKNVQLQVSQGMLSMKHLLD